MKLLTLCSRSFFWILCPTIMHHSNHIFCKTREAWEIIGSFARDDGILDLEKINKCFFLLRKVQDLLAMGELRFPDRKITHCSSISRCQSTINKWFNINYLSYPRLWGATQSNINIQRSLCLMGRLILRKYCFSLSFDL